MTFKLPSRSEVGILDPEIAGEGERVIYSDGETASWTPPPPQPVMPDMSKIASIARYFNRSGYKTWPAWVYHPTEEPRLLKSQDEASELGICYREATKDEKDRYGQKSVWDWQDDSLWRPTPYEGTQRFNPSKPGNGKTYIASMPNPVNAQNAMLEAIIPQVTAAVVKGLHSNGPAKPAHIDAKDWGEFLEFQAFKKSRQAVDEIEGEFAEDAASSNALSADDERALWEDEAKNKGIKVDGRWSLARLKEEVEKAD